MGPGELLHKTVEALEQAGVPYLVTGSVASTAWGEPRLTNDIDIWEMMLQQAKGK